MGVRTDFSDNGQNAGRREVVALGTLRKPRATRPQPRDLVPTQDLGLGAGTFPRYCRSLSVIPPFYEGNRYNEQTKVLSILIYLLIYVKPVYNFELLTLDLEQLFFSV